MCIQSEATLEKKLIEQLVGQDYKRVEISDESDLIINFKEQLEEHNKCKFSDAEFARILNHLDGGSIFDKAKKLRDHYELSKDDGDIKYVQFINSVEWCKNIFQVTNQITMVGRYENRYDVTILINGLPLMQIELKRRGIEMKEGFNQICRYHRHSFKGLFKYIQLFVISNGVNTKYFSNNRELDYKQTFFWTNSKNKKYSQLTDFTTHFLNTCHLAKMITKYIVLNETEKCLMVLRPYQYYAVEKIIGRVLKKVRKNGYIWHTTGSGKTLTSFKASQLLMTDKDVDKVVFVVDRNDLDYQTIKEFNSFSKGSVDSTNNTHHLIRQMIDPKVKLIITTIQKLNNAVSKTRNKARMKETSDKRTIFIFDECHRSQFGDTHTQIDDFFTNKVFFGFTGTPIFVENKIKNKTTADIFGDHLHEYTIKHAIDDENVLGFSVEYYSTFKDKSLKGEDGHDLDVDKMQKVEGINTKEVFERDDRLELIADNIIDNYNHKTYNKEFSSIFAISSIDTLIKYYDIFKKKKPDLKIATIFSYGANDDISNENGTFTAEELDKNNEPVPISTQDDCVHNREKLDEYILEFNSTFGTNHNLNVDHGYHAYFVDVAKKVKEKKIDLLLVVNMFLTGFDSKKLNTLYVDKNLQHHGLIQAFSRTNRLLGEKKKHGNIVCFRNLKKRTDAAIELFSRGGNSKVLMKPYDEYVSQFNAATQKLRAITPSVNSVDKLEGEEQKAQFVQEFRNMLRILNRLTTFNEFTFNDLAITKQEFEDYRGKYLDLYELVKNNTESEKASILDDLDFEVELIRRDNINASYIIKLLISLNRSAPGFLKDKEFILKVMDGSEDLRDKRALVKKFIEENLPEDTEHTEEAFDSYLDKEKEHELDLLIKQEFLDRDIIFSVAEEYEYSNKLHRKVVKSALTKELKFTERKKTITRITDAIKKITQKYMW